ncbi:hypothetical protein SSP35_35_00150 [Streptomyces sp. NBRC 110611]|nr:hypothetical protein SSP35_35_00150 [Streptomyces sp. NBRC 110611]
MQPLPTVSSSLAKRLRSEYRIHCGGAATRPSRPAARLSHRRAIESVIAPGAGGTPRSHVPGWRPSDHVRRSSGISLARERVVLRADLPDPADKWIHWQSGTAQLLPA